MKKISGAIILLLTVALCLGQPVQLTADSQPASSNVRVAEYPRVTSDLRAMFRIKVPDAGKVQIQLGKTYDMVKNDQGFWTVTTDPQVAGFHYYFLIIDGVQVSDPASESYFGYGKMTSGIEIPEKGVDYYTIKNVPHGDLRSKWYFSNITGKWRRAYIYCPPGYDNNINEKYPVLYLQHGMGEDERGWGIQGKVDIILDNLIADGKAKPMLIVMDQGYAEKPVNKSALQSGSGLDVKNDYRGVLVDSVAFNKRVRLLWIGIGTAEPAGLYKAVNGFHKSLLEAGIRHVYYESPGTAHEWLTWRRDLYDFAPRLFR
jgi:hypothetical protein